MVAAGRNEATREKKVSNGAARFGSCHKCRVNYLYNSLVVSCSKCRSSVHGRCCGHPSPKTLDQWTCPSEQCKSLTKPLVTLARDASQYPHANYTSTTTKTPLKPTTTHISQKNTKSHHTQLKQPNSTKSPTTKTTQNLSPPHTHIQATFPQQPKPHTHFKAPTDEIRELREKIMQLEFRLESLKLSLDEHTTTPQNLQQPLLPTPTLCFLPTQWKSKLPHVLPTPPRISNTQTRPPLLLLVHTLPKSGNKVQSREQGNYRRTFVGTPLEAKALPAPQIFELPTISKFKTQPHIHTLKKPSLTHLYHLSHHNQPTPHSHTNQPHHLITPTSTRKPQHHTNPQTQRFPNRRNQNVSPNPTPSPS
eukprot:GHVN01025498.1.p1 GENE.GHVN01025498.1~~GHVN01025498.1.p1  ORF type:complete len:363 (-),score=53.26 GHVN01025498.1:441-1529(-)